MANPHHGSVPGSERVEVEWCGTKAAIKAGRAKPMPGKRMRNEGGGQLETQVLLSVFHKKHSGARAGFCTCISDSRILHGENFARWKKKKRLLAQLTRPKESPSISREQAVLLKHVLSIWDGREHPIKLRSGVRSVDVETAGSAVL